MADSPKLKNIAILTGALLFFFGFPSVGLIYFRNDMHNKIEAQAEKDGQRLADLIFTGGLPALKENAVQSYRSELDDAHATEMLEMIGKLEGVPKLKAEKTWFEARQEQMWQRALVVGEVTGTKGKGRLQLSLIRPHVEPHWQIRSFKVTPLGSPPG